MSDTPRVDAEIERSKKELRNYQPHGMVYEQYQRMRDLARILERELNELKELCNTSCALCKRRYDAAAATGVGMTNAEREALHALAEALER